MPSVSPTKSPTDTANTLHVTDAPSWTPSLRPSLRPTSATGGAGADTGGTTIATEDGDAASASLTVISLAAAGGMAGLAALVVCFVRVRRKRRRKRHRRAFSAPSVLALQTAIELVPMGERECVAKPVNNKEAQGKKKAFGPPSPASRSFHEGSKRRDDGPGFRVVHALFAYAHRHVDELSFRAGEVLMLEEKRDGSSNQHEGRRQPDAGWCYGRNGAGKSGLVPLNYVTGYMSPGAAEEDEEDSSTSIITVEPCSPIEKGNPFLPCYLKEPADYCDGGGGGGGGGDDGRAPASNNDGDGKFSAFAELQARRAARGLDTGGSRRERSWSAAEATAAAATRKGRAGLGREFRQRRMRSSSGSSAGSHESKEAEERTKSPERPGPSTPQ